MKISIAFIIMAIVVWLWLNHEADTPVIVPETTLLPASQHRPVVGGEWLDVEERRF